MRACVDSARARRRDVCRHGLRGRHSFMLGDGGHACDVAFRRAEDTVVDQRGGCFHGRAGLAACVSQICTVQIPVQVSVLTAVGTGPGRRGGGPGWRHPCAGQHSLSEAAPCHPPVLRMPVRQRGLAPLLQLLPQFVPWKVKRCLPVFIRGWGWPCQGGIARS